MRRRTFLRTVSTVAAVTTATAAMPGSVVAAAEEGTTHTVEMTDGLVFEPDSLTIAPGDTVVFENVGSFGHSVTAYEDSLPEGADYWASGGFDTEQDARDAYSTTGSIEDTGNVAGGESWEHTFETEGTHEYFCIPHEGAEMVGQIEVTADPGTATSTETQTGETPTRTPEETPTDTQGGDEGDGQTVEMTDGLVFEPDSLAIEAGDTVVFDNVGGVGHSVTAYEDSLPEGADYWASGGFDSEDAARSAYSATGSLEDTGNVAGGESWEHTFETEGVHEYFCVPHEAGGGGMVGQIEVGAGAAPGDGDGSLPIGVPGLIFGGLGIGIASFLSGMYYGGKRNGEEQSTAALAGIGVVALGIVLLIAVVASLLVTG